MIVYKHIRHDTNKVFYIGIGSRIDRPYSRNDRNKYWNNIVNTTTYSVEIIGDTYTKSEAIELEIELIRMYGRKIDGGCLANMSLGGEMGTLGLKMLQETKDKISIKNKGRTQSIEEKIKRSKIRLGFKLDTETKLKIGLGNSKMIMSFNLETLESKVYKNITTAAVKLGISNSHIGQAAKGKRKACGGLMWFYYNNNINRM